MPIRSTSQNTQFISYIFGLCQRLPHFWTLAFTEACRCNMHYLHVNRLCSGITVIWQSITVLQPNTSARRSIIYHLSSRAVVQKSYSDMLSECKLKFYHPLNMDTCYNPSCKMTLHYISSNHWLKGEYYYSKHIITMKFTFSFLFIEFHILRKGE